MAPPPSPMELGETLDTIGLETANPETKKAMNVDDIKDCGTYQWLPRMKAI